MHVGSDPRSQQQGEFTHRSGGQLRGWGARRPSSWFCVPDLPPFLSEPWLLHQRDWFRGAQAFSQTALRLDPGFLPHQLWEPGLLTFLLSPISSYVTRGPHILPQRVAGKMKGDCTQEAPPRPVLPRGRHSLMVPFPVTSEVHTDPESLPGPACCNPPAWGCR